MQTSLKGAVALSVVLLNAYCFGANFVERFVNYQTWNLIPADAFKAHHRAQQPLIQTFVVAPMAFGFVLQVWLAFRVAGGVDPLVPWVIVVAPGAGALSTVMLQLPIHTAFNRRGYSQELMRRLLRTDWTRKVADSSPEASSGSLPQNLSSRQGRGWRRHSVRPSMYRREADKPKTGV